MRRDRGRERRGALVFVLVVFAGHGCGDDDGHDASDRGVRADDDAGAEAVRGGSGSGGSTARDGGATGAPSQAADGAVATHPDGSAALPLDPDADAGIAPDAAITDAGSTPDPGPTITEDDLPYARAVAEFSPGANAGFGQTGYPDNVLGPPSGLGTGGGSLDVLSLGVGGEIVLDFGAYGIVDEDGPDFIVFENAFWPSGNAADVFAELGEVAVSDDGDTWFTFACDVQGTGAAEFPGCAGWTPTLRYEPLEAFPLDPSETGGDAFDLAELAVTSARYVRIRDLSTSGNGTTAGFDLDAVGLINFETR